MAEIRHASGVERAFVLLITAVILFPVLWLLFLSFIPGQDIAAGIGAIGRRFTLQNFSGVWAVSYTHLTLPTSDLV